MLPQVLPGVRAQQADIRAAAAERRQAIAASATESSRSTTATSRLSQNPLENVIALVRGAVVPHTAL